MRKNIIKNTSWLFIFQIAKILFPFITLPYLTRVLSTEVYGTVTYVKAVMTYMQIFVDFGFILSGTKEIVNLLKKNDKKSINSIVGDTLVARIILGLIGFVIVTVLSLIIPILKENIVFTILSYVVVFESIFLMDFLFRGFEKMHVIAIRFLIMKTISTLFTFLLIKNDGNLLLIPILDIISSFIAILLVFYETKKLSIKFETTSIKSMLDKIKDSFTYFLSNAATTSFNALSTIIIGIILNAEEVAYWGVCMQVIGSITACYSPICDGIYPSMIKEKKYSLIRNTKKIFMPIVTIGCIFLYVASNIIFRILGGNKYLLAVPAFRLLIPVCFFAFLSIIHGFPCLGAIGKEKQVTKTTIVSALFNIIAMCILILFNHFTIALIAIIRVLTEVIMFSYRYYYYRKYKNLFEG